MFQDKLGKSAPRKTSTRNLLDTLAANGSFTHFAAAVDRAGLVDTLNGAGPFTLFAPTDAAFAKLPAGRLEALMRPENQAELASIVSYHVLKGSKTRAELGRWDSARMLQGQAVQLKLSGGRLSLDGAMIGESDIATSNGILHGLDSVNIPTEPPVTRQ